MGEFSYQRHHPFLVDSAHIPLLPQEVEEMSNGASRFLYYHTPDAIPETSTTESKAYKSSSSLDSARKSPAGESLMYYSSSVVVKPHAGMGVSNPHGSIEKRKNRDGSCLTSVQSTGAKESKSRKQKKPCGGGLKQTERKNPKAAEKKESKLFDKPPVGYIHVRARRGQATDSHSLAERVRREKISERMKLLQALVPGCDKVMGKALMLDEIINYVQYLQYQVEFLSMKLASVNPILYDFSEDFDGHPNQLEKLGSMSQDSQLVPDVHQTSLSQPKTCEITRRSYPIIDTSAPILLHGQGPIAFSQDNGSFQMQVGEQRLGFLNKCYFQ